MSEAEIAAEIKKIEDNVSQEGVTLADLMKQQHVTQADLRSQIAMQKTLEKLVGEQAQVSDNDVNAYIQSNQVTFPKGADEAVERAKVKDGLRQQKLGGLAQTFVANLKSQAKISYYVTY